MKHECLVYLLQAATVSQTDQSHAELFASSVQLRLSLLRQRTGGLVQHCQKRRKKKKNEY